MNTQTIPAVPCTITAISPATCEPVDGIDPFTFDATFWLDSLDTEDVLYLRGLGWNGNETLDQIIDDVFEIDAPAEVRTKVKAMLDLGLAARPNVDVDAAHRWITATASSHLGTIGDCVRCSQPMFEGFAAESDPVDLFGDAGCRFEYLPDNYEGSTSHIVAPQPDAPFPFGRCQRCGNGMRAANDGEFYCGDTDCSAGQGDFNCVECDLPSAHNGDGTASHWFGTPDMDSFVWDSDHVALDPAGYDVDTDDQHTLIDQTYLWAVEAGDSPVVGLFADHGWALDLASHVDGHVRPIRETDTATVFAAVVAYNEGVDPDMAGGEFYNIGVVAEHDVADAWVTSSKMLSSWGFTQWYDGQVADSQVRTLDGSDRKDAIKAVSRLLEVGKAKAANIIDGDTHLLPDDRFVRGMVDAVLAAHVERDTTAAVKAANYLLGMDDDACWDWERSNPEPGLLLFDRDGTRWEISVEHKHGLSAAYNVADYGNTVQTGLPEQCWNPWRIARKVKRLAAG